MLSQGSWIYIKNLGKCLSEKGAEDYIDRHSQGSEISKWNVIVILKFPFSRYIFN